MKAEIICSHFESFSTQKHSAAGDDLLFRWSNTNI